MKTRDVNEYVIEQTQLLGAFRQSSQNIRMFSKLCRKAPRSCDCVLEYSTIPKNVLYIVIMYKQIIYYFAAKCLTKVRDSKNYSDL